MVPSDILDSRHTLLLEPIDRTHAASAPSYLTGGSR
jgi:hypothetical protein